MVVYDSVSKFLRTMPGISMEDEVYSNHLREFLGVTASVSTVVDHAADLTGNHTLFLQDVPEFKGQGHVFDPAKSVKDRLKMSRI